MSDEKDNVVALPRDAEADTIETEPVEAAPAIISAENPVDELLEIGDRQTEIDERPTAKHPHPVDGEALADEIADSYVPDFVVLPEHSEAIITMSVFASYLVHTGSLDYAPRIVITAPDYASGKTILMTVLESIVFNPFPVSDFSPALYALQCHDRHTMMLDECHNNILGTANRTRLLGMINAGHSRVFARKQTLKTKHNLFTTVYMAGITGGGNKFTNAEVDSRSYQIDLMRKLSHEVVRKFIARDEAERAGEIRAKLFRWTIDNAEDVRQCRPAVSAEFGHRDGDNAITYLQIANTLSPRWGERVRTALQHFKRGSGLSDGELLFADLATLIREGGLSPVKLKHAGDFLFTPDIVKALTEWFPDRQLYDGWQATGAWRLRNALKGYKIKGDQNRRPGAGKKAAPVGGYYWDELLPIFERYELSLTKDAQASTTPLPSEPKRNWLTPPDKAREWDAEFHFDFDACPPPGWAGHGAFDGLREPWPDQAKSVYMNIPFNSDDEFGREGKKGGKTDWGRKAIAERDRGKTIVMVCPPNAALLNLMLDAGAEIRPLGRIRWLDVDTREPAPSGDNATMFILRPAEAGEPAAPIEPPATIAPRPRTGKGFCPDCHVLQNVRKDGTVWPHSTGKRIAGIPVTCPGGGKPSAPAKLNQIDNGTPAP